MTVVCVVIGSALLPAGASSVRDWLAERAERDVVAVRATLRVTASSSSPPGGSVYYFVRVTNTGPRPVRITGVRLTEPWLDIRNRRLPAGEVPPGATVPVLLSVRLDCTGAPLGVREVLTGVVSARAESGRGRDVRTSFAGAAPLTGSVDTLCRVKPGLRGAQLSGALRGAE